MCASKHKLGNLTVIIDYNKLQSYGRNDEVQPLEPLAGKWRAFGFETREIDGHDLGALREVLIQPLASEKPAVVICHTIKGKGIHFAEGQARWHHKSNLGAREIQDLYDALETCNA